MTGILQHSPNWVFIKDLAGRYVLVDDSFRRSVGCDPIGKTPHDLFPKEVADLLAAGDKDVVIQGVGSESEVVIPSGDGPHTYMWAKFPLCDADGQVTGVGGIATDVTLIKKAEVTAQEMLAQQEQFLAMLSHELRNPLAAVVNAAGLIKRAGVGSPQASEWFGVIERRSGTWP